MQSRTNGLVAAPFTPFLPNGNLNLDQIPRLVDHYVTNELEGLFVCGSTGEGPSLTSAERMQVAEHFHDSAKGSLRLWIHIGHSSLAEAKILAQHAQSLGVDAISATLPTYYKIESESVLIDCLQEISSAAESTPFYYYHIPSLTGVVVDVVSLLESVQESIPNFAGIKFSSPALHDFQACVVAVDKKFDMLYGADEMFLPALSVGAQGFIGSTYNFMAPIYFQIRSAFESGDLVHARNLQNWVIEVVRLLLKYGLLPTQKSIMHRLGLDCGPVRLPLKSPSKQDLNNFHHALDSLDFFDRIT
ncbi:MAG: N-acetylneuraminate lyase [Saprospiraceae bacterium]|nr:N-acetylneuraminate lyase [Saprospiraceae bacterium]